MHGISGRRTPDAGRRTPDAGRRTPDAGRRTPDADNAKPDPTPWQVLKRLFISAMLFDLVF